MIRDLQLKSKMDVHFQKYRLTFGQVGSSKAKISVRGLFDFFIFILLKS